MRRTIGILAILSGMGAGLVALSPSAGSLPVDLGVVDVSVTLANSPASISPPGELVLLTAVVKNEGALAATPSLSVSLAAGSVYRTDLSATACVPSTPTAVGCTVGTLQPGTSKTFEIVAHTSPTAGTQTSIAAVSPGAGLVEPLEYSENNTATLPVEVTASTGSFAAGLVERGKSLSIVVGDGREYTLTVPQESPGVIVKELRAKSGSGYTCGSNECGNGFKLDFVQHAYYKAEDPLHPLVTLRTFGNGDPCYGLGPACSSIYIQKFDNPAVPLEPMPYCPGAAGGATGSGTMDPTTQKPCINRKFKVGTTQTWYEGRLLSNDPVELAPYLQSVAG
jgi:hypothetical protein